MKTADYSPPTAPSPDQQRDALRKGLGRSLQWALAGQLEDGPLLDACLHDLRFDCQADEYRGPWLWEVAEAARAADRFRSVLLEALQTISDGGTGCQLCGIGVHYAANGDEAFRSRLYQIVREKPVEGFPWMAEHEIIQLDGQSAFLFAAGRRGRELAKRAWDWHDGAFVDDAVEQLGVDRITKALDASEGEATIRFRDAWWRQAAANQERSPRQSYSECMKQIPLDDVIAAAESVSNQRMNFRGWGIWAAARDLEIVFERLLSCRDPKTITNYLRVFSMRAFPRVVPEVVSLSRHADEDVRHWAFHALERNTHPLVRELAEHELQNGIPEGRSLGLFVKNYQPGDEHRIVELLDLPEDDNQLHWLLMDAVKVCEENPHAECSRLGVMAYALTPCGCCRHEAAKLLHSRGVAPSWLTEECRFDSDCETRRFADGSGNE